MRGPGKVGKIATIAKIAANERNASRYGLATSCRLNKPMLREHLSEDFSTASDRLCSERIFPINNLYVTQQALSERSIGLDRLLSALIDYD